MRIVVVVSLRGRRIKGCGFFFGLFFGILFGSLFELFILTMVQECMGLSRVAWRQLENGSVGACMEEAVLACQFVRTSRARRRIVAGSRRGSDRGNMMC